MTSTLTTPLPPQGSSPADQQASSGHRWSTGHIRLLDGLRGCAVLSVMLYHFTAPEMTVKATGLLGRLQAVMAAGWCGVDLFFVLSGFLITGILLDAKGHSQTYFKSFYVRRVLRIFPLYYGVILFAAVGRHIPWLSHFIGFDEITSSLWWMAGYLSNFVITFKHNKLTFGPMGHFWSLAVEEHFYMVWPAVVWFCTRRQLTFACLGFIVGALVLRVLLALHNPTTYATYQLTPCRVDGLAAGALLAILVRGGLNVDRLRQAAWIALAGSFVLLMGLGFRGGGGFSHYGRAMTTAGFSCFALFFFSLMLLGVSARPGSALRRTLEIAPLMSVGRYSFAMYIFHLYFMRSFLICFPIATLGRMFHSTNLGLALFALLSCTATYLLAWLSWHLYEQNFLRLKRLFPY